MVDAEKLYLSMGCRQDKFTFNKFLYMCILSGCDYVDSLHGIGLAKACKFVLKTEDDDIRRALAKIPAYLNMRHLTITEDYKDNFLKAAATFRHMFVYDPLQRQMRRLSTTQINETDFPYCCNAGVKDLDDETAFQLALGNLDPFTLKKMDDWHPDKKVFYFLLFINGFFFLNLLLYNLIANEYKKVRNHFSGETCKYLAIGL